MSNNDKISLSKWQADGNFFQYKRFDISYDIFYRDSASQVADDAMKPVLLLIHGFPTASIDWHRIWPAFNEQFRLITLDMMGFGLSDKPKHYQYSIHDQADIYQSLLNKLAIKKYHILAHDYGDTVAQELLAREIERKKEIKSGVIEKNILSAILLNGGLFPETHRPVFMQKLLASPLGALLIKFYSYSKFKQTFEHICAQPISDKELEIYWHLLQHNSGTAVMPKLIRYMQERKIHREKWVGALQHNPAPMRLIDGVADPISGAHMVERYKELIDEADIVELKDVGHYPQVEAPQQVVIAAMDFWRKNSVI